MSNQPTPHLVIPTITRICITVGEHMQDHLTQEQAEDVLNGCRMAGVKPHVKVCFHGTDFAQIYAWIGPLLPQGISKTPARRYYRAP